MLQSKSRLLFNARVLFMGNSLPPAPSEVGAHVISTSQKRRKVEGEGSCSRSHSWQVGESGFELSLPPGGHCSPFQKVPFFLASNAPHPFHKTKSQQGRRLALLTWECRNCSQLVPLPGCVTWDKCLYSPVFICKMRGKTLLTFNEYEIFFW